jgi:hypothetical protein
MNALDIITSIVGLYAAVIGTLAYRRRYREPREQPRRRITEAVQCGSCLGTGKDRDGKCLMCSGRGKTLHTWTV